MSSSDMFSVKQNQSTKGKQFDLDSEEAVRIALIDFAVYLIFLLVTTIVALSSRHIYMYYFNTTIYNLFLSSDVTEFIDESISFEEIVTTADCWNFFENTVLPHLHGLEEQNSRGGNETSVKEESKGEKGQAERADGASNAKQTRSKKRKRHLEDDEQYKLLRENLLLGPPRLRQIRVQKDSCNVHEAFTRYFDACYAEYDQDVEDKTSDFKGTKYDDVGTFNFLTLFAKIGEYHGGGYTVQLTYNREENVKIIKNLKSDMWIDRSSRILLFEFTLYNGNTALFNSVKMFCELPPTGGAIPFYHIQTVKLYNIWMESYFVIFVAILLYVFTGYYIVEEVRAFRRMGFYNYISSTWNIVAFLIIVLSFLSFVYNIWHPIYLKGLLQILSVQPQMYQNLDVICFWNFLYTDMMAILAFVVWIKVFKYISFSRTLQQFNLTFKKCAGDLFGFGLMFTIVFLAYAELGLVLFGTHHTEFRNFEQSFLTMTRMVLGDFEYEAIEETNQYLGPIFFLSFTILVFFILLNMFLAIIAETYSQVKSELKHGQDQMMTYLKKRLVKLFDFLRTLKNRLQKKNTAEKPHVEPQNSPNNHIALPMNHDENEMTDNPKDRVVDIPQEKKPETPRASVETPLRVRESEVFTTFFEEVPESENVRRLAQRIVLLEDVMEQLIKNLDHVMQKIDAKKHSKS